jgi:hydrophobic/amphiphilic exporter-1 (mainly G- bacteria), HAE1 family
MGKLGTWSINNRVAVNLIMIFIIVAGLDRVTSMRREMFPQFAIDMIHVSIDYPGASPEEVEEGICIKVEEKIKSIEGICRIVSTARENMGSITAELESGVDVQQVMDDIKTEINGIDTFPEQSEDPSIIKVILRDPAVTVAVYGDVSEKILRNIAENIRDDLVDTEAISFVELVGVRDYEISVEVSEETLRRYGLNFEQVVAAIKTGSVNLPGGTIKTSHGEIMIRSKGQLYTGREIEGLPLITRKDGTVVPLGQVAQVIDGFQDTDIRTKFNGKPAALVQINRTSNEDLIKISDTVRDYVQKHNSKMPQGIRLARWFDLSDMVRERISLLLYNGSQGIFLVFIFLALFLNLGLSFWVSIGIPISFMGAFLVLDYQDQTINMISLFAFIMTLGILVDDAVIIGENIFTHYSKGKSPSQAVAHGLSEVGLSVIMAVATTITAFTPLLNIPGIMGKFVAVMPMAVIIILTVSLLEALVILPAHIHHALVRTARPDNKISSFHKKLRKKVDRALNLVIERLYAPALKYVVTNRYFSFTIGLGILIISIGIVIGGYVPFVFMTKGESDWIIAEVNYPSGSPDKVTEETIQYLEKKAFELNLYFKENTGREKKLVTNIYSMVGMIPRRDWKPAVYGGHCGQVWIELISSAKRPELSVNAVINKWRNIAGEIPGVERLAFFTIEGGPAGSPIEVQLSGHDFEQLRQAADELKAEIKTYPGTYDISDDFRPGKEEKQARIKKGARSLGISMADIAKQIRQAFYGEQALRIQRGRDDIKVMVRYAASDRRRISGIEEMRIRSVGGKEIPIEEVADITENRAYSMIRRVDRKRVITVNSDIDESIANAGSIVAELNAGFLPKLIQRYPGLKYNLEGQEKRTRQALNSLKKGFSLALMGIFLLLASRFRSYIQPVIIMTAIPFGLIGAIGGHLVMGMNLTMMSIFGVVALSGIVVNDSLILIDFVNRAGRQGIEIKHAVIQSGKARFRPVLLTSITTIAGLFPLLLERSFQAQFLIPMAVSISFGLIAATLLTLLYVPALYLIIEDIRNLKVAGLHS